MSKRAYDVRDTNEPEICDALMEHRIPFWKLKPGDGADLMVTVPYSGTVEFVEVKAMGGRMTKREKELEYWCDQHGVVYRIVRTANDVRDAYAKRTATVFDRIAHLSKETK